MSSQRIIGHSFQVVPLPGTAESGEQKFLMVGGNIVKGTTVTAVKSIEFSVSEKSYLWVDTIGNIGATTINTSSIPGYGMRLIAVVSPNSVNQHQMGDIVDDNYYIFISKKEDENAPGTFYWSVRIRTFIQKFANTSPVFLDCELKTVIPASEWYRINIVTPSCIIGTYSIIKWGDILDGTNKTPLAAYGGDVFTTRTRLRNITSGQNWLYGETLIAQILLNHDSGIIYGFSQTNSDTSLQLWHPSYMPLAPVYQAHSYKNWYYDESNGHISFSGTGYPTGGANIPANSSNFGLYYHASNHSIDSNSTDGQTMGTVSTGPDRELTAYAVKDNMDGFMNTNVYVGSFVTGVNFGSQSVTMKNFYVKGGGRFQKLT